MTSLIHRLVMKKGPNPGQVYPLNAPSITIGRDPLSDIVLSDPEVSRYHARITQTDDGGYQLEDIKSTNGSHVDGVRLGDEPALLQSGQTLLFGSALSLLYEVVEEQMEDGLSATVLDGVSPVDVVAEEPVADWMDFESAPRSQTAPRSDPEPSPPVVETPPAAEYAPPPVVTPGQNNNKRNIMIALTITLFLICCCCLFLVVMYQWGGDLLMQELGVY